MAAGRALEYRIVRQLMQERDNVARSWWRCLPERLISILAVVIGLIFLGSYLETMLFLVLACSVVLVMGTK